MSLSLSVSGSLFVGAIRSIRGCCVALGAAVLIAAPGCSRDPLDPAGTGGAGPAPQVGTGEGGAAGGAGGIGGNAATGGTGGDIVGTGEAGATGGSNAGRTGRQAFVVTGTVTPTSIVAGASNVLTAVTQTFTMVVDWDAKLIIAGAVGGGGETPLLSLVGGQYETGGVTTPIVIGDGMPAACPTRKISYEDLLLAFSDSGLFHGAGMGHEIAVSGDVESAVSVMIGLSGVPDTEPPTLVLDDGPIDPFALPILRTSEPVPTDATVVLVDDLGNRTPLNPVLGDGVAVFGFGQPSTFLGYATHYRVAVEGLRDFTGNTPSSAFVPPELMTVDLPPLVAEDGFESLTSAAWSGPTGQILDADSGVVITGQHSLYIPQGSRDLSLRLALSPGDTVVRFSYRVANQVSANSGRSAAYALGVAGLPIAPFSVDESIDPSLTADVNVPGIGQLEVGPPRTAEALIPPRGAGEVVLSRRDGLDSCGGPASPVNGLIIDDLRAE